MQESKCNLCFSISTATQRRLRSPLNSTNAQEATLGQEKKRQEFLQKPWERQLGVQLQGKCFCAKMEKDVPANQIRGDSTTELTTQPAGRWGRTLPTLQPGLQRRPGRHPCLQERGWYPYLDAEALGLDEGQSYVLVILPGFTDEVHFLPEVFLDVLFRSRVHHCGFDL